MSCFGGRSAQPRSSRPACALWFFVLHYKGATQSGSLGYDGRQQLFQLFNFTSKNVSKSEFELIWIIAAHAALLD